MLLHLSTFVICTYLINSSETDDINTRDNGSSFNDYYHKIEKRQTHINNFDESTSFSSYRDRPLHTSNREWNRGPYTSLYDGSMPPLPFPEHNWDPPAPPPQHNWGPTDHEYNWRPPPPPHEEKRQGPPYMIRGPPPPPPPYGRYPFDNKRPPNEYQPGHRVPPDLYQNRRQPVFRHELINKNLQDIYIFEAILNHKGKTVFGNNINKKPTNMAFPAIEEKLPVENIYRVEELIHKENLNQKHSKPMDENNIEITYDAGQAVALLNGNCNSSVKVVPVTLIFQAQPVTPASE